MDPKNPDDVRAAEKLVAWLRQSVLEDATGEKLTTLSTQPAGTFWLGRLTSEDAVFEDGMDSRGDRLDPCSLGLRFLPRGPAPWRFTARVRACAWIKRKDGSVWDKTASIDVDVPVELPSANAQLTVGQEALRGALAAVVGTPVLSARLEVEAFSQPDARTEVTVLLVNSSPKESKDLADTHVYECSLAISGLDTEPYVLEQLPDVFRYDRKVPAYGINCGVRVQERGVLATIDDPTSQRMRPAFWPHGIPQPDFRFDALAADPLPLSRQLIEALTRWGDANWSDARLSQRCVNEGWSDEILARAKEGGRDFRVELARVASGVAILEQNPQLLMAFKAMNASMIISAQGKYDAWRPFQLGFLLANLHDLAIGNGRDTADVVWFATGGGKTETYLGLLLTAAFLDRLRGKTHGITAWSRFPLRMLSLQQTQRFANALAAAELERRDRGMGGEPFSLGFLVGSGATPNAIKTEPSEGEPDPDDDEMPGRYRLLERCPFCRQDSIVMSFDHRTWTLRHGCNNDACAWPEEALPCYLVDDEIYRFLPTIIVGTLDKAANIGMQAAMRGFVGAPAGVCSEPGHGHVYAKRSNKPNGCLVPGCTARRNQLPQAAEHYAVSFRLQDELHLLRDSLGAIDAHYEALLDGLEEQICGTKPKILASSATLAGYDKQVSVLYRRDARVFPQPAPEPGGGFWSRDTADLMRTYVALAPRGVTIEHATDRILTVLQRCIRALVRDPINVCQALKIDPSKAPGLVSLYGTNVVYGNTLRDLDAVNRSIEGQQVLVDGPVRTAALTGRTDFPEVRKVLRRLENPESAFEDRIHVIAASSMMSHGVDIDRLNVMVMIGLPLGTAEFIQTSARVGRSWPGLIFVLHKIARERDAGVFRTFEKFVEHGDRFVEPIPITRRSRRVLERTLAGLMHARLLHFHEARSGEPLTTPARVRAYRQQGRLDLAEEEARFIAMLGIDGPLDLPIKEELANWLARYSRLIDNPAAGTRFSSQMYPGDFGPMRSLRDVEESVPIYGREDE